MIIIKFILSAVFCSFCVSFGLWLLFKSFELLTAALLWIKRRKRKQETDRSIIHRAKACGVWDKPQCLGGKALELKAWQEFKIKRNPGETDACLRIRCMNEAENEYANKEWFHDR